jgi:hypothetical protein
MLACYKRTSNSADSASITSKTAKPHSRYEDTVSASWEVPALKVGFLRSPIALGHVQLGKRHRSGRPSNYSTRFSQISLQ